jgi:hypothetical protein
MSPQSEMNMRPYVKESEISRSMSRCGDDFNRDRAQIYNLPTLKNCVGFLDLK